MEAGWNGGHDGLRLPQDGLHLSPQSLEGSHVPGVPPARVQLSLAAASCLEEKSNTAWSQGDGAGTQSLRTPP